MRDVVVTRVRRTPARQSRNGLDCLVARFPVVYHGLAAIGLRLFGPRSRLRRFVLQRVLDSGWSSLDRRDFELNTLFFAPDVVFEASAELQTVGLDPVYRGRAGRVDALRMWLEAWESTEMTPELMIDLGDRLLTLGHLRTHGRASGVDVEQPFSQLVTVRNGLVSRDRVFLSWRDGIEAAGLEPDAFVPS